MNVLIARTIHDCEGWRGICVVVDVLRTTTTLCALLAKQNRTALICRSEKLAGAILPLHPELAVFSEQNLSLPHEDNSPYLASKLPDTTPAMIVSAELSNTLKTLKTSSHILLGGFCNFYTLADTIAALGQDVLLVPSCLFASHVEEEDTLCVAALQDCLHGTVKPERAVEEFKGTMRYAEFKNRDSKIISKDLKQALKIDGIPVVPQAVLSKGENWAVCVAAGAKLDPVWLDESGVKIPPEEETSPQADGLAAVSPVEEQSEEQAVSLDTVSLTDLSASAPAQQQSAAQEKQPTLDDVSEIPADTTFAKASQAAAEEEETAPEVVPPVEAEKPKNVVKKERAEKEPSALKSFFIGIADSIKKEKQELSQSWNQEPARREEMPAPKFADPMDTLLKNSPQAEENPAKADDKAEKTQTEKQMPSLEITEPPSKKAPAETAKAAADKKPSKKAIVLLSGGLDSTTCLYWAISQGYTCEALSVSYGQRHERELACAKAVCEKLGVKHQVVKLNLPWLSASSLVDVAKPLPDVAVEKIPHMGIPSTYVPGRNLLFLAVAGSLLDVVNADAIVAGPNAIDFSGYPDCTPAFFKAAGEALNRGTSRGVSEGIEVLAPLMRLSKAEIVKLADELKVPFELTWSCYAGGEKPCGKCDSCKLRAKGFEEAGIHDTALD